MSLVQYRRLLRNVVINSGKPLALQESGARIPITALGPVGKAFVASPSWQTGLACRALLDEWLKLCGRMPVGTRLVGGGDGGSAGL